MSAPARLQPARDPFMQALWRHRGDRGAVPSLLRAAQEERGWVGRSHLELIAAVMDVPLEELNRQVEVLPELRSEPLGSHLVQTCDGLACRLGAGHRLHGVLVRELGIQPGQTTADGSVTWRVVPCLGACVRAPAMTVDNLVFGPLTDSGAVEILGRLRAGCLPAAPPQVVSAPPKGRLVQVTGRVRHPCLTRVRPETTLTDLIALAGGERPGGAPLKAVLYGGRLMSARQAGVRLPAPDGLEAAGRPLQILVLDESTCVADLMVVLSSRAAAWACGRCTLGRLGTRRMVSMAEMIRHGAGANGIEALRAMGHQVAAGARCAGCRNPASTVVDALAAFPEEVWAHAVAGRCTAGTCGVAP